MLILLIRYLFNKEFVKEIREIEREEKSEKTENNSNKKENSKPNPFNILERFKKKNKQ